MLVNAIAARAVGGPPEWQKQAAMDAGEEGIARRSLSRLFQRHPVLGLVIDNAPLIMLAGVVVFWGIRVMELRRMRIALQARTMPAAQQPRPIRPVQHAQQPAPVRQPQNSPLGSYAPLGSDARGPAVPIPLTFDDDPLGEQIMADMAASLGLGSG